VLLLVKEADVLPAQSREVDVSQAGRELLRHVLEAVVLRHCSEEHDERSTDVAESVDHHVVLEIVERRLELGHLVQRVVGRHGGDQFTDENGRAWHRAAHDRSRNDPHHKRGSLRSRESDRIKERELRRASLRFQRCRSVSFQVLADDRPAASLP